MDISYFKKEVPQTPVYLQNGAKLVFDTADGITGFTLSADPGIIAQLQRCVSKGIGGVQPASQDEYGEFLKKKAILPHGQPPREWREEIRPTQYAPQPDATRPAAAVVSPPPPPSVANPAPDPTTAFKPKTGLKKARATATA